MLFSVSTPGNWDNGEIIVQDWFEELKRLVPTE